MKRLFDKLSMIFIITLISMSMAHGLTVGFDDSSTSITDFKASENTVLSSSFNLESSTDDKTVVYTFPEALGFSAPTDVLSSSSTSGGVTTLTITYGAGQTGITTTGVTLWLKGSKVHSKASYPITVEFNDGNGGTESATANITVFDYAGETDGNEKPVNYIGFYRMLTETDPLFNDSQLNFKFQPNSHGAYNSSGSLGGDGYTTTLKNITINLSQLQVDTTGTGNNFTLVDPSAITVDTSNNSVQSYDPSTGIISFNDIVITNTGLLSVDLTLGSSEFPAGSLVRFIPENLLSYTACENDSDCTGTEPEGEIEVDSTHTPYTFEILDEGHYFNPSILKTSSKDRVQTDIANQPLFQIIGENYLEKLENISFNVQVPNGMTIQQIFAGSGEYSSVTIDDGTNPSQTFTQNDNGQYFDNAIDLDYPITGDFTVTLESYDKTKKDEDPDNPYFPDIFIKALGEIDGSIYSDGDSFTVSIDADNISADIVDYPSAGTTTSNQAITDPISAGNTLTRTIKKLQLPAPYISNTFEDNSNPGTAITDITYNASQQVGIDMVSKINIYDYAYGSDYHQLDNPVIYFSVPKELVAESGNFSSSDIELTDSELGDVSDKITDVETVSGNSTFSDGKIIEIKMNDYSLIYPNTLTARLKTVISPSVITTTNITEGSSHYSIAVGSLNSETTETLQTVSSNTINATDLVSSSDAVDNKLVTNALSDLSIVIPSSITARLLVNSTIDTNDNEDEDYKAVFLSTENEDYPEYYLEANGAYRVIFNNATTLDANNFYSIITLPDIGVDQIIEASDDSANDPGAPVATVTYSADGVNFGALPVDGKVVAIRYDFTTFGALESYQANIPFSTNGLTTKDDSIYGPDTVAKGEILYNYDGTDYTGTTTGIQVIKSDPPEITFTDIADNDEYDYDDITNFKTDITSYTASDDRSESITDIIKDDSTLVSFTKDAESSGTSTTGTLSFADLETIASSYIDSDYDAGKFVITYKTDKDSDAQQAEELINITIYPKPYLTDPTTDPVSIEYGSSMTLDDLITQSGITDKGNDSDHYSLDKTSPDTIDTKDITESAIPVTVNLDDTGHSNNAIDNKTANYIVTLPVLTLSNTTVYVTQGSTMTNPELSNQFGITVTGDASGDVAASVTDSSLVDFSTVGCYPVTVTMTDSATLIDLDTQNPQVCIEELVLGVTPTNTTPIPSTSLYSLLMLMLLLSGLTYYRKK